MKKIFKGLFILLFLVLLSGCKKDFKEITYSTFMETLRNEKGFLVNTYTPIYDSNIEKSISASSENSQFLFFVFGNKEQAKSYVEKNYKNFKGYKLMTITSLDKISNNSFIASLILLNLKIIILL